jgi:tRNA(fMet)-specific endonuclease VapC
MIYFLDTNICIYHLNGSVPNINERLKQADINTIKIPSMVAAELLYGVEKSGRREHNIKMVTTFLSLFKTVPFDRKSAEYYGVIRAELERGGKSIGGNDLIIAATALANAAVLVTHNINEFSRIHGLLLEDWTDR